MPITDQLMNGLELMLLGMGIVFVFLMILVVALYGMSKLSALLDQSDIQAHTVSTSPPATAIKPENTALIAVISAAVARYRSAHNQH